MTLAFSALAPYRVSLPPHPQCQTRNQTRIRSDIQTVSPVSLITTRRSLLHHSSTILLYFFTGGDASAASAVKFFEIAGSGGVKALELRAGSGGTPRDGDEVAIHYYGRLAAKQGWRFDSTYDHKDETGYSIPFVFTVGSRKVIPGIEAAVKSMKVGGILRAVIPPSQGYQSTSQEPIPPNVKAHKKGGVTDLAVHPSGRVALTVGRGDSSLVMVNLVRGRRIFSCRIEKEASVVKYGGESGDWFAIASEGRITVHNS